MRVCHRYTLLLAVLALAGCSDEETPTAVTAPAVVPTVETPVAAPTPVSASAPAPVPAPVPVAAANALFDTVELDQMLAPLALYPDALLAQVLMATTYPGDVADAVAWSKAHPDSSGDVAVRAVADQPWDPSVQSLVAFPAALATLGQDPAWVQRVGDAFLAQPDAVMDSVQRLRRKAQAAGHLESNEQQRVSVQPAAPASSSSGEVVQQPAATQTIIIEPTQPQVVYVPSYNPSVVYGTWPYPSSPPAYYPPPPGYYFGGALAAGLGFAAGVAIIDSLWGDCDWDNDDIDIDVDRYNNINSNRQINANQNNWQHNAINRDGVPYRDRASREQYGQRLSGSEQRDAFRGRDVARSAERERARQSLQQRGIDAPATSNSQARERAEVASREFDRQAQARVRAQAASRELGRETQARQGLQNNPQARQQARQQYASTQGTRSNAFAGARSPTQARAQVSRGQVSQAAARRPQAARDSGRTVQRASRAPSGGGGRRR